MDAATGDDTTTGPRAARTELRAMRTEVKALELAVLQFDLVAKQGLVNSGLADDLVARHAAEVRARLAETMASVAVLTTTLELLAAEATGR